MTAPFAQLPDNGLVVVVKQDCATCRMVAPLLGLLQSTTYTQDDPEFPPGVAAVHDVDLEFSWRHEIETVPTLLRVVDGVEVERTVGWSRSEWQRITGIADLGAELPVMRPGCGSMSVDPDRVDALRARFDGDVLKARRIELADLDDEIETMFDRGFTDGLPVVPPTPERVLRMLQGTTRDPAEVVATVPPDLADVTVEKVAINAVMAGCKPEYMPWVLAALEAICTDEFNIHGVLATTMPVGPVIVCNGPGTAAIGMNGGGNVLGQGNRANLTIGRAVQLVVRNVGGGRPGGVDRATHGNPGKLSFCFAELESSSPFSSLAVSRGVAPGANAVTVFAGEGPRCVVDQKARDPESLANTFAACL
ncbi:MAG: thioredoxin family protein, partial [Ilumatobacteraceae bacterium]